MSRVEYHLQGSGLELQIAGFSALSFAFEHAVGELNEVVCFHLEGLALGVDQAYS